MERIRVSFDIEVKGVSEMTEESLAKDVKRMLDVYARSHGLCIDNVSMSPVKELALPWGWLNK